jgi:hypothetical protein
MAGTIPLSMTQQFDEYGAPLAGGKLYIIQAGTVSTPQNAYVDTGLVTAQPYPMTLDAAGRVPQFFLDDSVSNLVKIRLQNAAGVVQLSADSVLIIGPSISGGGGGSTVDSTQLIQIGDMKFRYGIGSITGFVRLNGRTIGSATSGATERPNADCQALFLYLWTDFSLVVSSGRGATAAGDWAANKQLTLPDFRGYAVAGLDDMGNTAAGRLTSTYFGAAATVLGAVGGSESTTLTLAQLPTGITGTGSASVDSDGNDDIPRIDTGGNGLQDASTVIGTPNCRVFPGSVASGHNIHSSGTSSFTSNNTSGAAHRTISPRKLITFYIKL